MYGRLRQFVLRFVSEIVEISTIIKKSSMMATDRISQLFIESPSFNKKNQPILLLLLINWYMSLSRL